MTVSRAQQVVDAIAALGDSPDVDLVTRTLNEWDVRDIASALVSTSGGGGGSTPTIETVTITAAEIAARWDGGLSAAYTECCELADGDTVLAYWYKTTLNQGDVSDVYLYSAGATSAQVGNNSDLSIATNILGNTGTFAYQWSGTKILLPVTVITGDCVGYLSVTPDMPATGDVELTMFVIRAA